MLLESRSPVSLQLPSHTMSETEYFYGMSHLANCGVEFNQVIA